MNEPLHVKYQVVRCFPLEIISASNFERDQFMY